MDAIFSNNLLVFLSPKCDISDEASLVKSPVSRAGVISFPAQDIYFVKFPNFRNKFGLTADSSSKLTSAMFAATNIPPYLRSILVCGQ